MISTGDVKKGVIIELDGQLMKVLDWSHIKMARGSAQVRMKLHERAHAATSSSAPSRPARAGRVPGSSSAMRSTCTRTAATYHFMDTETYDQFAVAAALLGDDARFLLENTEVQVSTHEGEVLGVELPITVDLRVTQTDPGFAGDTATGAKKQATVETGLVGRRSRSS